MTFAEYAKLRLTEEGFTPEEADAAFTYIKNYPSEQSMLRRWNDNMTDYPINVAATMAANIVRLGKQWKSLQQTEDNSDGR